MDPRFVFGFGSLGSLTAFAGSLDFSAHLLVPGFSFSLVLAGEDVGVVGVDFGFGDAELECRPVTRGPQVGAAPAVCSGSRDEDAVAEAAAV
jgi:hypothetical protein